MRNVEAFRFTDSWEAKPEAFAAEVPAGITDSGALLTAIAERLLFPGYFGFNWNALSDCLRDFHWLPEGEVVLRHNDLPRVPESDLRVYLDVLAEAVTSWSHGGEQRFVVVFPAFVRAQIAKLRDA